MPRAPIIVAGESLQTGPTGPPANASSFAADTSGLARGLAGLASGASQVADVLFKQKEFKEREALRTWESDSDFAISEFFAKEESAGTIHDGDIATRFEQWSQQTGQERIKTLGNLSDRYREIGESSWNNMVRQAQLKAVVHQQIGLRKQTQQYFELRLDNAGQVVVDAAMTGDGKAALMRHRQLLQDSIVDMEESGIIRDQENLEKLRRSVDQLSVLAIESALNTGPDEAEQLLNDEDIRRTLSGAQVVTLTRRINSARDQGRTTTNKTLQRELGNLIVEISNTGEDQAVADAKALAATIDDPEARGAYLQDIEIAQATSVFNRTVPGLSYDKVLEARDAALASVSDWDAEQKNRFARTLQTAVEKIEDTIDNDPAAHFQMAEVVQQEFAQMREAPAEEQPAIAQRAYTKMLDLMDEAGVPLQNRFLLTRQKAREVADDIAAKVRTPETEMPIGQGPEQAFMQIEQSYGAHAPRVMSQLAKLENNPLPLEYFVASYALDGTQAGIQTFRTLAAAAEGKHGLLDPELRRGIEESVRENETLQRYAAMVRERTVAAPDLEMLDAMQSLSEKAARILLNPESGNPRAAKDPDAAVEAAVSMILGNQFDVGLRSQPFFVPTHMLNNLPGENANEKASSLRRLLRQYQGMEWKNVAKIRDNSEEPISDKKFSSFVQNSAVWRVSDDETSLELYLSDVPGRPIQVFNDDETPVVIRLDRPVAVPKTVRLPENSFSGGQAVPQNLPLPLIPPTSDSGGPYSRKFF